MKILPIELRRNERKEIEEWKLFGYIDLLR
jgi:hypothetical protein